MGELLTVWRLFRQGSRASEWDGSISDVVVRCILVCRFADKPPILLFHVVGVNDAVCCRGRVPFLHLALLVFSTCLELPLGYRVVPFHRKAKQAPIPVSGKHSLFHK